MSTSSLSEEEIKRLVQDEALQLPDMGIVVSGIAGRFPKSDSMNEFEENLFTGKDMINDNDNSRFSCGLWNLPPRAGRLKDLSKFDHEFFGLTQDEADYTDFQLRILYEVVYESIVDAGVNPNSLRGTNTGVFFGLHCNEFENAMVDDPGYKSTGYYAQFALRVAQYFDFRGCTVTFDAACASGFVGLHNASEALNEGVIDRAIVCSVNIPVHPTGSYIFLQMQMLSPTGNSRFLDSRADGYVKSESCVSILLQRKDVALRNYASLMATLTSVDGYKQEGITFPSYKSQEELIRRTKLKANLHTNHVQYLEAHGTGTPAGDPQEARAISNVYFPVPNEEIVSASTSERRLIGPLLVGSVKTNMGHSEAASGLCSLAKITLMLENELIYKGLHYEQPNGTIESLKEGKLKFVDQTIPLLGKIVPLSCYGFGGANVHVIVRANESSAIKDNEHEIKQEPLKLIVMFGRSEDSVNYFFDRMMDQVARHTKNCLKEDFITLLDSLNSGKIDQMMSYRGYLLVRCNGEKFEELSRNVKECNLPSLRTILHSEKLIDEGRGIHIQDCALPDCHLLFPGLGSQWTGMAIGLRHYKPFWSTLERLAEHLRPFKLDLVSLMATKQSEEFHSMKETFVSIVAYQLALINIVKDQLALRKHQQLKSIVGHSLGEIACAFAADLITEYQAILIAFMVGKVLDENKHSIEGRLLVADMNENEALELIQTTSTLVKVACINGHSVTLSGGCKDIEQVISVLKDKGIYAQLLSNCEIALHNEFIMNSKIREALVKAISQVIPQEVLDIKSSIWISSVNNDTSSFTGPEYFANNLCSQVNFLGALNKSFELNVKHPKIPKIFLELGPSGQFESQLLGINCADYRYIKMMKRGVRSDEQVSTLLQSIGQLYQAGAVIDISRFRSLIGSKESSRKVRRRTPSISSLFKWKHENNLFVPRYPIHFSKSSAKCELPIDIVQDRDKFISDHCIEGRILYPATGYLFLIWRVFSFTKRHIYDACFNEVEKELVPVEFHNVRLLRAILLTLNKSSQIYIHLEEGTGHFEIKEGGSLVAEGFVRSPTEKPEGLLYEESLERLKNDPELKELTLNTDDIYKQFRLSGYDYGPAFQNIEAATSDGRRSLVKYNGHFMAFTDSILQSVFMAVSEYAPSGGLFLPTKLEYVRFQPAQILKKIRNAGWCFDLSDGSLNTAAKREIMSKIMEREFSVASGADQHEQDTCEISKEEVAAPAEEKRQKCIFETFCEPSTGIIITEGIEMRGIKATPVSRRIDSSNEPLLESYAFIRDFEDLLEDEPYLAHRRVLEPYARVCDAMAFELLCQVIGDGNASHKVNNSCMMVEAGAEGKIARKEEVEAYKKAYLRQIFDSNNSKEYKIEANATRTLMSVLDQLIASKVTLKELPEVVQANRLHLMRDLLQSSQTNERFIRPIMETVLENCAAKGKARVRVLEVNPDDGLLCVQVRDFARKIAPQLGLDYELAHPEPSRLGSSLLPSGVKTHAMRGSVQQLLGAAESMDGQQAVVRGNLDLIVYKDVSCYSLPKRQIEANGLMPVLSSLKGACAPGGFILVILRQSLTRAERLLLALADPELVGMSRRSIERSIKLDSSYSSLVSSVRSGRSDQSTQLVASKTKIALMNSILQERYQLMLSEGERNKLICIARKSEPFGSTLLLFRRPEQQVSAQSARLLLRVSHEEPQSWLPQLKRAFAEPSSSTTDQEGGAVKSPEQEQMVWLCAVASAERPVSGLPGLMQALGRELGFKRLRCFLDQHSFRTRKGLISVQEIETSDTFQRALARGGLVWNCIDETGCFGSFRHLTVGSYLAREDCRCDAPPMIAAGSLQPEVAEYARPCYVNTATRGDLSSLSWFEAPFSLKRKPAKEEQEQTLVSVAYSALNFRDVMIATGRLPPSAIPIKLAQKECLIGLEFSGIEQGTGKRVAGMVSGAGLASHVACPKGSSIRLEVPESMSLKDAAGIPVAYATVIMALVCRARAKAGESILIHAASGGVGQAAIRLAQYLGLEIYATVGTTEKRQFLMEKFSLSSRKIFNSRDLSFELDLMHATSGRGVDMVLNSLADEKLQASLRCLAPGGRFLEIGKYDMSVDAPIELSQLNENISFHGILLDMLFAGDDDDGSVPGGSNGTTRQCLFKDQLKVVLKYLQEGLREAGFVQPIEHKLFPRQQVEDAFRFMAAGKHIGKILIEIDPTLELEKPERNESLQPASLASGQIVPVYRMNCIPRVQLDPNKSYIVTGGLGGFGLELVKWLARKGARYLVLTSRSGLRTGYQRTSLRRLESDHVGGAKARILLLSDMDATTREGAQQLVDRARAFAPSRSLGGLFHLAMVLKDALLENLTEQDLDLVCRPKVSMCEHLDSICCKSNGLYLDYFVAFSSVAAGKGNAGQAGYAYANSAMEGICLRRRARGEHGLAIQWGAVGDVGVAYENLGGNNVIIGGTIPQRIPSCLQTLERLMCSPFTICSSLVPAYRDGGPSGSDGARADLVGAIMHVLGIKDPSRVAEQSTLAELGLDSLMAVEIRQYIEREFQITLNIQEIRSLTIAKIREIGATGKTTQAAKQQSGAIGTPLQQQTQLKEVQNYGTQNPSETQTDLIAFAKGAISFMPDLELPKDDFIPLNEREKTVGRPIFFLPPVHGRFHQLKLVCAYIKRPCWGLNWTKRFGIAKSIQEAADIFLDLLRYANWKEKFHYNVDSTDHRYQVDLVGYSYGATIAFEMMLALHHQASVSPKTTRKGANHLTSGQLTLLDGSPKQIELCTYYLSMMSSQKQLTPLQKQDELLIAFVAANLPCDSAESQNWIKRKQELDQIRTAIKNCKFVREKCELAAEKLDEILVAASAPSRKPLIVQSIEALCKKYHIVEEYKADKNLPSDCTLIRAEEVFIKSIKKETYNKDLDVGSVVDGHLNLFIMPGNHESFLEGKNSHEIAHIISQQE